MIERLYVHNFRCLENFTLDFSGQRSALLIGKNGSGKSTVLHALRVFQSICRGPNRVRDVIRAKDFTRLNKSLPMRFELDVTLGNKRFSYKVAFEWPDNFYEARIIEETLLKEGRSVFSRKEGQVQLGDREFGLDWHVFALPVINEKPPEQSIRQVKAFLGSMILLAPIPQMIEGFSEAPVSELDGSALNFTSCLRDMIQKKPKSYNEFVTLIKKVLPEFSSLEYPARGKEGGSQLTVTFEKEGKSQTFDFDVLSDGEKCFFLSAYISAANAVRSSDDPPVVCVWDEPDSHLSISEVGHFIQSMRKTADRGGQFIATSHHPETIRKFSDDNTFVLTRKSHLEPTVVKQIGDYSYNGDLIHALIRDEIIG